MRTRSLAHEVLHNWWGNAVSIDYAGGNWAEGLTTYMADYALELDKGEAAARNMRVKWLRDYAALPAERDQPVRAFRSKQHQAGQVIGYNKAAFIFHMLSMEIGQSAFDAGLRRFWVDHKYKTAGWRELKSAFENASGRELGWFFEQWLDRRGAPRLGLGEHRVTQVEAGYRTDVTLLQPVAGYRFQLQVLLMTDDGPERRDITVNATRTSIEWISPSKPRYIQFDPESDVFRRLNLNEAPPILRDVTLDPMAVTVIGAGDAAVARIARELATRLLDAPPRILEPDAATKVNRPLLLISTSDRLPGLLDRLSLQRPNELPRTAHSAAAWTARLPNGSPALVISADDATELQALLRPLPHYGGQSYVLFVGGRALQRGIWPISRGPLYRDLASGP
jgi:aminopeptidase N